MARLRNELIYCLTRESHGCSNVQARASIRAAAIRAVAAAAVGAAVGAAQGAAAVRAAAVGAAVRAPVRAASARLPGPRAVCQRAAERGGGADGTCRCARCQMFKRSAQNGTGVVRPTTARQLEPAAWQPRKRP